MPLTSPFLFGGKWPGKRGPLGHLPLNALKNPYIPRVSRVALNEKPLGPLLRSGPPVPNLLSQSFGDGFALATMGVILHPSPLATAMPYYPDCIPAQCQACDNVYGFAPRCDAAVLVCAMYPSGPATPSKCPDFVARAEGAPVEGPWTAHVGTMGATPQATK